MAASYRSTTAVQLLLTVLLAAVIVAYSSASPIVEPFASEDLSAKLRHPSRVHDVIVHLKQQVDIQGVVRGVDAKIASTAAAQLFSASERSDFIAHELVHELRMVADMTQRPMLTFLKEKRHTDIRPLWIINAIAVKDAPLSLLEDLVSRFGDQIDMIDLNDAVSIVPPVENRRVPPSAPIRKGSDLIEENLDFIQATDMWQLGYTGEGIVISVVDTGVDCEHPALREKYQGRNNDNYSWWDPYRKSPACKDSQSHGTHCTGIVLGSTGTGGADQHFYGVAPKAEFSACLGLNGGSGSIDALVSCWQFVLAPTDVTGQNPDPSRRPHITSNSWGGAYSSSKIAYKRAAEAIRAAGIFNSVAAGNSGRSGCKTLLVPGAFEEVATVCANDHRNSNVTDFSSRGPVDVTIGSHHKPDFCAPGQSILSPVPGGKYSSLSGTSMATPHVAGAVALLWEAVPGLARNVDVTENILSLSAQRKFDQQCSPPQDIPNYVYGHGNVKILEAFKMAKSLRL